MELLLELAAGEAMAAKPTTISAALRLHWCGSRNPSFRSFVTRGLSSFESSRSGGGVGVDDFVKPEGDLRSRIFRLRFPKRSATEAVERWVEEGGKVSVQELRQITRELRRAQRYKHALEVRLSSH